ncbi:hypothetical protein MY10362_005007 [Beauveria mimosiformis]
MPFFKKSKKADLGSTASEVTLVDPSAQAAAKGTSQAIKSKPKHPPKQKPLTSEIDKWNTIEARLAYIINKRRSRPPIPKAKFPAFPAQQETVSILAQDDIRDINATSKADQNCTLAATFGAATVLVTGGVWPSDIGYLDTTVLGSKFERGALVPYWSLV